MTITARPQNKKTNFEETTWFSLKRLFFCFPCFLFVFGFEMQTKSCVFFVFGDFLQP
jgi:hypothetical protein